MPVGGWAPAEDALLRGREEELELVGLLAGAGGGPRRLCPVAERKREERGSREHEGWVLGSVAAGVRLGGR